MDNPLLAPVGLPAFEQITAAHVVPAIRARCAEQNAIVAALEAAPVPTWEGLFEPLADVSEPLTWSWEVVNHLMGVRNSPELRQAHGEVQGEVISTFLRLAQSRPIFDAAVALQAGPEWATLSPARQRIVNAWIRDARLAGVALSGDDKARFTTIAQELSEMATRFSNQVLDSTKAWKMTLEYPEQVAGLPTTLRAGMARVAAPPGHVPDPELGPWAVTLDAPIFGPFMEHCRDRHLREMAYRAFITRASRGDLDNAPLVERILRLRQTQAQLLGFASYAEQSLAAKMAGSVSAIHALLADLRAAAKPKAESELAELATMAGVPASDIEPWDVSFWAERLRERTFAFTDEDLRPYFALDRVLAGLFALATRLFDIVVREATAEVSRWHDDVRFFRIFDATTGQERAAFFLDPYSRPADKRGGAWMAGPVGRRRFRDGSVRLPVAYLVCNQTPPAGGKPSLMTFREVETLFHEFGHGLQHLLTTVDDPGATGIDNVEWDAVELPSQFMENWCLDRPTLAGMAIHWQTGEALPQRLETAIRQSITFRAGSMTMRQVAFATVDLDLHHLYDPAHGDDDSALDIQQRVLAEHATVPPLAEDRTLCSFSHIFAGGYAAGYYSYKWAEVLSADAFAAFEEAGLDNDAAVRATGRRFRDTVLAMGGSRHPMDVFRAFRGREPNAAALLRHSGLSA